MVLPSPPSGPERVRWLHDLADAVGQEPSGFHAAIEGPLNLAGANALLAGADKLDGLKPQVQREVAVLEDRADPHGEGLTAGVALAQARTAGLAGQAADSLVDRNCRNGGKPGLRATDGPRHRRKRPLRCENGGRIRTGLAIGNLLWPQYLYLAYGVVKCNVAKGAELSPRKSPRPKCRLLGSKSAPPPPMGFSR